MDAVADLQLVAALDEAVQHPDMMADTAMLEQVRRCSGMGLAGGTGAGRGE